jgi:predicted nucleic acid-binding protein
MANRIAVFDTSVFIDHLRANRFKEQIAGLSGLVRNSSVVLAELLRGATRQAEIDFVQTLAANHPVFTPTEKTWLESGELLSLINRDKGYSAEKLRDLHFDVLIALTARQHGATLITSNRSDFELIRIYKKFKLEIWQ